MLIHVSGASDVLTLGGLPVNHTELEFSGPKFDPKVPPFGSCGFPQKGFTVTTLVRG